MSVVSEIKQHSEHSQIFDFNSSKAKQRSERSQRFYFRINEKKPP